MMQNVRSPQDEVSVTHQVEHLFLDDGEFGAVEDAAPGLGIGEIGRAHV